MHQAFVQATSSLVPCPTSRCQEIAIVYRSDPNAASLVFWNLVIESEFPIEQLTCGRGITLFVFGTSKNQFVVNDFDTFFCLPPKRRLTIEQRNPPVRNLLRRQSVRLGRRLVIAKD
jgi:hypothetical protein